LVAAAKPADFPRENVMMKKVMALGFMLLLPLFLSSMPDSAGPAVPSSDDSGKNDRLAEDSVAIGEQVWTSRNLDATRFRNGDPIPQAESKEEWMEAFKAEKPAWCRFDNLESNGEEYGILYNWYAVTDSRGLAPEGWHVPSDAEFAELFKYLGEMDEAGGLLKEKGCARWKEPNTGGSDAFRFRALPGGARRGSDGAFLHLGELAAFWTATPADDETSRRLRAEAATPHDPNVSYSWSIKLSSMTAAVNRHDCYAGDGYSVRLVRDSQKSNFQSGR
jgi:uncharacterized protein (TIGR02145 family)